MPLPATLPSFTSQLAAKLQSDTFSPVFTYPITFTTEYTKFAQTATIYSIDTPMVFNPGAMSSALQPLINNVTGNPQTAAQYHGAAFAGFWAGAQWKQLSAMALPPLILSTQWVTIASAMVMPPTVAAGKSIIESQLLPLYAEAFATNMPVPVFTARLCNIYMLATLALKVQLTGVAVNIAPLPPTIPYVSIVPVL